MAKQGGSHGTGLVGGVPSGAANFGAVADGDQDGFTVVCPDAFRVPAETCLLLASLVRSSAEARRKGSKAA